MVAAGRFLIFVFSISELGSPNGEYMSIARPLFWVAAGMKKPLGSRIVLFQPMCVLSVPLRIVLHALTRP